MIPLLSSYLRLASTLTPRQAAERAVRLVGGRLAAHAARRRDRGRPTYADGGPGPLHRYVAVPDLASLQASAPAIVGVGRRLLHHRIDLLGSGWTRLSDAVRCRGVEGHVQAAIGVSAGRPVNAANRSESERIRGLIGPGYQAIDWHLDVKSGYRWAKDTWYRDVPYGHLPGVDVKLPWELARMQHLPVLAWAYALAKAGTAGFEPPERYAAEFRDQVLDFIADNPPRFGVNWRCAMDVAIRLANWLVGRDLILAAGAAFDADFEEVFARSVLEHGRHIAANLEWDPDFRANHYLADIVGLLYAAAWLPRNAETDAWLALGVQELIAETARQFHPDGGNFEGSIAYHRLSLEMVVHATALVLALPADRLAALKAYDHRRFPRRPALAPAPLPTSTLPGTGRSSPLPPEHFARLAVAGRFAAAVTKPSGRMAQIGDNDSGRFLRLTPAWRRLSVAEAKARYATLAGYDELHDDADYWDDDPLDAGALLAALRGLFSDIDIPSPTSGFTIETAIVAALAQGAAPAVPARNGTAPFPAPIPQPPAGTTLLDAEIRIPGEKLLDGLTLDAFADFGLYVWRSARLFLAVRCGPIGQNGRGGHAHNDQLAVELAVDGEDWIADPGTYLYTPLPERRNAYRSVAAHFAPRWEDREPGRLDLGPFWLGDEAKARCLAVGPDGFLGCHDGFGRRVFRRIRLDEGVIRIRDVIEGPVEPVPDRIVVTGRAATRAVFQPAVPFSPGYGLLLSDGATG